MDIECFDCGGSGFSAWPPYWPNALPPPCHVCGGHGRLSADEQDCEQDEQVYECLYTLPHS